MIQHRKIDLPDYCCQDEIHTIGGDEQCDHDYPPEEKQEFEEYVSWTCSLCGMKVNVGIYE